MAMTVLVWEKNRSLNNMQKKEEYSSRKLDIALIIFYKLFKQINDVRKQSISRIELIIPDKIKAILISFPFHYQLKM